MCSVLSSFGQDNQYLIGTAAGTINSPAYSLTFSAGEPWVMSSSRSYKLSVGYIDVEHIDVIAGARAKQVNEPNVYPNPFREVINVELQTGQEYLVHLYDLSGKLIFSKEIRNESRLSISPKIISGSYMLEIVNKNNSEKSLSKIIRYVNETRSHFLIIPL